MAGVIRDAFLTLFRDVVFFVSDLIPMLSGFWKKNVQDPRASLDESAVGAVDGTALFHVSAGGEGKPEDWYKSGSMRDPKTCLTRWTWVTLTATVEVAYARLDTWEGSERIDFIWTDVQGGGRRSGSGRSAYSRGAASRLRNRDAIQFRCLVPSASLC